MDIPNSKKSLGKMRHGMPQLPDFNAFASDLKACDVSLTACKMKPSMLTPTQQNFNQGKVDKLKASDKKGHPIIISKDDYVVDGHHRWLAAHQQSEDIACQRVDLNVDDLLDFLKDKPYVKKNTINEDTIYATA